MNAVRSLPSLAHLLHRLGCARCPKVAFNQLSLRFNALKRRCTLEDVHNSAQRADTRAGKTCRLPVARRDQPDFPGGLVLQLYYSGLEFLNTKFEAWREIVRKAEESSSLAFQKQTKN